MSSSEIIRYHILRAMVKLLHLAGSISDPNRERDIEVTLDGREPSGFSVNQFARAVPAIWRSRAYRLRFACDSALAHAEEMAELIKADIRLEAPVV